jgi:hypothetical protein
VHRFPWLVLVAALTLSVALLVGVASAHANTPRVTQGDAEALFQAWNNGGWAMLINGGTVEEGAPADFLPPDTTARISPAAQWNGKHFCSLDWHVIAVAAIEGNPAGGTRTNQELLERLSLVDVRFTLDGAPLDTTTNAVRRMTNPGLRGFVEAFSVITGRVMAPEDLSVGQHSLFALGMGRPGSPPTPMGPITFFIDAPGEGACL